MSEGVKLRKYFFDPLEDLLLDRLVFDLKRRTELRQQILLLPRKLRRNDNIHCHIEITTSRAAALGNAASFYAVCRTRLCSRRNVQFLVFAFKRRNGEMRPKGGLRKGNRNMAVEIVITSFKELVLLHVEHDVKITWRATLAAGVTLRRYSQLGSNIDARRDAQLEHFLAHHAAISATHTAAVFDDLSGAVALCAGAGDAEKSLLEANLTVAVAC